MQPWPVVLTSLAAAAAVTGPVAMAGSRAAARISCGDVVTQDTTLTRNLTGCPGNGLVVAAPDVTLDLGGHTVSGTNGGFGIEVAADGVTVQNGTVASFAVGVDGEGNFDGHATANHGTVRNVTLRANARAAIANLSVDGWSIQDDDILENADGIDFVHATNMVVSGNRIAHNVADGIYSVSSSDGATLSANRVVSNGGNGILVSNSTSQIVGNTASGNHLNGIVLHETPGFGDRIADNVANANGELGITADFEGFDGGGNVARGNGDPRQCVNVGCSPR